MPNLPISQLPVASLLTTSSLVVAVDGGVTKQATIDVLKTPIRESLSPLSASVLGFTSDPTLYTLTVNTTDRTLDLNMGTPGVTNQLGQELYYPPVVNADSQTLIQGTLVMIDPTDVAQGNRIRVVRMVGDGTYPSQYIVGILTEDIAQNQTGFATWFGYVRNASLPDLQPVGETWVEGDILYGNPSIPGGLTKILPQAPNIDATIAAITAINGNNVTFLVRPTITFNVDELNNVLDTTTTGSYGDLFVKNGNIWNSGKQLTGSYGLTGSLDVTEGVILTSPNNTKYRLIVDNSGNLSTTAI